MKTKKKFDKARFFFIFFACAWPLLHWTVFTLYMNIRALIDSFTNWNPYLGANEWVGLRNYTTMLQQLWNSIQNPNMQNDWLIAIGNSFTWFFTNYFIMIPLSLLIAFVLSKKIRGWNFFRIVLFLPTIISVVIYTMATRFMLHPTQGPINAILSMFGYDPIAFLGNVKTAFPTVVFYCVWSGLGWNITVFMGAMASIPTDLYESATIDGANKWVEFIHITLPGIWNTIYTFILMGAGIGGIMTQALLLTNGTFNTTGISLELYELGLAGQTGPGAAASVLFAFVSAPILFLVKFIIDKISQRLE